MLHYKTIDSSTLDLLIELQAKPAFKDLRLVGGTALALQIGHRKSIDIDLFGVITADEFDVSSQIASIGDTTILRKSTNISIYLIKGIKIDIVNYSYHWIENPVIEDGLLLADIKDIAAMKIAAITGRGTKKDFVDLYFLLRYFNLNQILDFYRKKYPDGSDFLVLKSLSYFIDADNDEDPVMLIDEKWECIKAYIMETVNDYMVGMAGEKK
ncbi:nucleotidyl transferase AbiEii/AbiGii toxin family protein [Albibacterium sp.]|jgi:hypothetical protein|uniref:nucleotidyl transferase AbiEii/AbiGii toxin family protein n=1 Tax=Albibacterium sp. TaxID=2952885 RepID=UPI0016A1B34B|nr:nucleotidyl transferase AbiEii/AbiGii toxin family protein [Albibacterium sp.]NLX73735.1 nucleotidyl transferase AbiEii/AbiGii toxin family protein [Bacteroidales bacterium]HUH17985.1 nucleotidyl transferase AbiEii/AbiGii toxin family protein [Albibacterium sp.]